MFTKDIYMNVNSRAVHNSQQQETTPTSINRRIYCGTFIEWDVIQQ